MRATTDAAAVRLAIESNHYELFLRAARLAGIGIYQSSALSWVNGAPSRWPNGIFGAHFEAGESEKIVQSVTGQILEQKAPRVWLTGPAYGPDNLEDTLVRQGFERRSETAGMAVEMDALRTDFETPDEFIIRRVEDEATLRDWARVVGLGLFGLPEAEVIHFFTLMSAAKAYTWLDLYIGLYQGQAAASSTLYASNGIAGIYHVATLPEFRGKGIGRQITLAPTLRGRELGCELAILQATQAGAFVYRQLGFEEYSRLGRYWLAR